MHSILVLSHWYGSFRYYILHLPFFLQDRVVAFFLLLTAIALFRWQLLKVGFRSFDIFLELMPSLIRGTCELYLFVDFKFQSPAPLYSPLYRQVQLAFYEYPHQVLLFCSFLAVLIKLFVTGCFHVIQGNCFQARGSFSDNISKLMDMLFPCWKILRKLNSCLRFFL